MILMAVHEGAATLEDQLESLSTQRHPNWSLLVSVDGAKDGSDRIIDAFAARMAPRGHTVRRIAGPQAGSARNFMHLTAAAAQYMTDETWLAFSDQDDVWLPERISNGLETLLTGTAETPALHCSRTWITDAQLGNRRLSVARPRQPGFSNALVQNIVAGNTILLNPAGGQLICAAAQETTMAGSFPVAHDWWIYQIVTGCGGWIAHDDRPALFYRQHDANEVGANDGMRAKLRRIGMILDGTYRDWNRRNIQVLRISAHRFRPERRAMLEHFAAALDAPLARRLRGLSDLGVYRQGRLSDLALWVAAILGRL
ncbi:hypothetical protein ATO6_22745 [Oceanicola sp. 22II-s10i]|nr:hypothetical protein ATO6_22745 [Oceanicola sp. 22II-s10i]